MLNIVEFLYIDLQLNRTKRSQSRFALRDGFITPMSRWQLKRNSHPSDTTSFKILFSCMAMYTPLEAWKFDKDDYDKDDNDKDANDKDATRSSLTYFYMLATTLVNYN